MGETSLLSQTGHSLFEKIPQHLLQRYLSLPFLSVLLPMNKLINLSGWEYYLLK
jgi:hypothetical protein